MGVLSTCAWIRREVLSEPPPSADVRRRLVNFGLAALAAVVLVFYVAPGNEPAIADATAQLKPVTIPADQTSVARTVYLPVYTRLSLGQNIKTDAVPLAATVSIHNVSRHHPIVLQSVTHYDEAGRTIREYLAEPAQLDPLASVSFVAASPDGAPASNGKFLVQWTGPQEVEEPLVEAVMVGRAAGAGISFTSVGRHVAHESLE